MQGFINPLNCSIHFRFRYWDDDDDVFLTIVDKIAAAGSHWHYWSSGPYTERVFEVIGNSNPACRMTSRSMVTCERRGELWARTDVA